MTTAPGYVLTGAGLQKLPLTPRRLAPWLGQAVTPGPFGVLKSFCRTDLVPASRRSYPPLATSRLWDAACTVQEPVLDRWLSAGDPGAVMAAGLPVG